MRDFADVKVLTASTPLSQTLQNQRLPTTMAYQSYSIDSKATLGCRFIQDEERGKDAGICTAALIPGGTAARLGIVVGMVIHSIHGTSVKGTEFNEVMQLVRSARSNNRSWTIELIHPMNQPAEDSIRWATLLTEKGLNEYDQGNAGGEQKGISAGLRRLSVAVGIKTHEEDSHKPAPLKMEPYHRSDEGGVGRRASISSQGSDGAGSRRSSLTGGTPPAPGSSRRGSIGSGTSGRRGSIGSEPRSARRGSVVSQSSDTAPAPSSVPPGPSGRRGSVSSQGSSDAAPPAMPPGGRRRGSISMNTSSLSPVPDRSNVPSFDTGRQTIGKYTVLAKCTVREGKSGDTTKVGEYSKGTILDIVEEAVNEKGLAVVRTTTRTDSGATGGWVKMRTAKGKLLLEQSQGVRSDRRMSVASVDSAGNTIGTEELIDVTFTGSGALGILFEEISSVNGRPGNDIAIRKINDGSIAADIVDVQIGLVLRSVNKIATLGLAYKDAMKVIGSEWRSSDEMTLTFAKPQLVDGSEEEDLEDSSSPVKLGGRSPGGREWVDGAAIQHKSAMMSSMDSQVSAEELQVVEGPLDLPVINTSVPDKASAMKISAEDSSPAITSSVPDQIPEVPPEVFEFMEQNGAGEYATKLCKTLGVTRVEDFLELEMDDYEPLNMKTIPKRRLLRAVAAMKPAEQSYEEAVPTLAVAQPAVPHLPEAPAEKPQPQPTVGSTKPLVNVYISPFLDQPETTFEVDRIRERMKSLEGQPGRLKCMRADYTGWDVVESFNV